MSERSRQPVQGSEALLDGKGPEVMTVEELADLLRVNRKTAYEAISLGTIPGVRRIGRTIRISRAAVVQWLREGRVSSEDR